MLDMEDMVDEEDMLDMLDMKDMDEIVTGDIIGNYYFLCDLLDSAARPLLPSCSMPSAA